MKTTIILALLFLSACGAVHSDPVYLKHPDGRTVQCGPYSTLAGQSDAAVFAERGCIDDYQRQGFLRVPGR